MVQWLRLHGPSGGGPGSMTPGQGTEDLVCHNEDLAWPNKFFKSIQVRYRILGAGALG